MPSTRTAVGQSPHSELPNRDISPAECISYLVLVKRPCHCLSISLKIENAELMMINIPTRPPYGPRVHGREVEWWVARAPMRVVTNGAEAESCGLPGYHCISPEGCLVSPLRILSITLTVSPSSICYLPCNRYGVPHGFPSTLPPSFRTFSWPCLLKWVRRLRNSLVLKVFDVTFSQLQPGLLIFDLYPCP